MSGDKGAIRITTQRLLTPGGASLDGKGLVPEVVIEQAPQSPLCRSLDQPDASKPGLCRPRPLDADGELQRAVGLIAEATVAGKAAGAEGRP